MEREPRIVRPLDRSEREIVAERFSKSETDTLVKYLGMQGSLSISLNREGSGAFGALAEMNIERHRRGMLPNVELSLADIADIRALAGRLDAISARLPERTTCRFVNLPESMSDPEFQIELRTTGGVSKDEREAAQHENKLPAIYADTRKVDEIIRGREAIKQKGRGFVVLVYDLQQLRTVRADEARAYTFSATASPYALVPSEGGTFKDALSAILSFEADTEETT